MLLLRLLWDIYKICFLWIINAIKRLSEPASDKDESWEPYGKLHKGEIILINHTIHFYHSL